jgi:peptidoglycan/xylan/chitin deacetylase (PgdA/CDA1 family)
MKAMLDRYVDATEEFDCRPTFPVTAVTLKRHPSIIRGLSERGVEIAIHGNIHTDHKQLSLADQESHFEKAIKTFDACQVPFKGFRGPYLRRNAATLEALSKFEFSYDSSDVIYWDVVEASSFKNRYWRNYRQLLEFYEARNAEHHLSIPRLQDGLAVIPVSMPDDESMVGRLGITDKKRIEQIWQSVLDSTYERGDLFTIQLHHERVPHCALALRNILQNARCQTPSVWIATLSEIAEWWKERSRFKFGLQQEGEGRWRVRADCTDRASVLARNCRVHLDEMEWASGYRLVKSREFVVDSPLRPAIGVAPGTAEEAVKLLRSEGYIVEPSEQREEYALYFDNLMHFSADDELSVARLAQDSDAPLVRFWRWPDGARSALTVTGDIDSITLIDFVMRIFEVWRQRIASRNHARCPVE